MSEWFQGLHTHKNAIVGNPTLVPLPQIDMYILERAHTEGTLIGMYIIHIVDEKSLSH